MLITSRLAAKPNIKKFPVVCILCKSINLGLGSDVHAITPGSKKSRNSWDYPLLLPHDHSFCRTYSRLLLPLGKPLI